MHAPYAQYSAADDVIKINRDIPHNMTLEGLEYLGRMARTVPKGGLILEVGPLFGASTWVMANNCDPSVRVISVDTWEPRSWIGAIEAKFPGCKPFSKAAFDHYTRDCPNVTAIQGFSPHVLGDFKKPIDLFFDDAAHADPSFSESLSYYVPRIRTGGIVCGDDFASGWPDLVRGVHRLAKSWNACPEICGRVWGLVKPGEGEIAPRVYDVIGPRGPAEIECEIRTTSRYCRTAPGCWVGGLRPDSPIYAVCVRAAFGSVPLDGAIQLVTRRQSGIGYSHWARFGQWIEAYDVAGMRAHLMGIHSRDFQLHYQGQLASDDGEKIVWRNTKGYKNADILTGEENEWLSDVRFWLEPSGN